jgi:hypothetical protein
MGSYPRASILTIELSLVESAHEKPTGRAIKSTGKRACKRPLGLCRRHALAIARALLAAHRLCCDYLLFALVVQQALARALGLAALPGPCGLPADPCGSPRRLYTGSPS